MAAAAIRAYALVGEELTGASLDAADLLRAGAISFSLTVVNIACIIVVAMIMFKVKEVAPIKGKSLLFQKNVRRRMEHQYRATMADPRLARAVRLVRPCPCPCCPPPSPLPGSRLRVHVS